MAEDPRVRIERTATRAGVGCGSAMGFAVLTLAITVAGVLVHQWVDPSYTGSGVGQGEGILAGMVLLVTPVVGLAAAWKPAVGIGLGVLVLALLFAFHGAACAMG